MQHEDTVRFIDDSPLNTCVAHDNEPGWRDYTALQHDNASYFAIFRSENIERSR